MLGMLHLEILLTELTPGGTQYVEDIIYNTLRFYCNSIFK